MIKNEFLEKLKSDETYQQTLKLARSNEERVKISSAAESIFDALFGIVTKFNDLKNDPEKMKEVIQLFESTNKDES